MCTQERAVKPEQISEAGKINELITSTVSSVLDNMEGSHTGLYLPTRKSYVKSLRLTYQLIDDADHDLFEWAATSLLL